MNVLEIMEEYSVSESTARRCLRKGTIPCPVRRIGVDGKSYPDASRVTFDPEWRRLSTARSAVKHANGEKTLSDKSMQALQEIRQLCDAIVEGRKKNFTGEWVRKTTWVVGGELLSD